MRNNSSTTNLYLITFLTLLLAAASLVNLDAMSSQAMAHQKASAERATATLGF